MVPTRYFKQNSRTFQDHFPGLLAHNISGKSVTRPCSSQSICALACDIIFFSKSNNNILNKFCGVSSKLIEEKHLDRLGGEMMSHEYDDTKK